MAGKNALVIRPQWVLQANVSDDNKAEIWSQPPHWIPESHNKKVTFTATQISRAFGNQSDSIPPVPKGKGKEILVAFKGLIPPEGQVEIEFRLIIKSS